MKRKNFIIMLCLSALFIYSCYKQGKDSAPEKVQDIERNELKQEDNDDHSKYDNNEQSKSSSSDDFLELMRSDYRKIEITDKYTVITNLDCDIIIESSEKYFVDGVEFSSEEGWWALIDTKEKKVLKYQPEKIILGVFRMQKDYLIYDQGTCLGRNNYVYDLYTDFSYEIGSYGKDSILINSARDKIAVNFLSNKDFFMGIDPYETARIGIRVVDLKTGTMKELTPKTDVNYLLSSFEDELIYKENDSLKVFPLE